jgi:hypothetical protein
VNRTEFDILTTRLSVQGLQEDGSILWNGGKAELFETVSRPQENTRLEILRLFLDRIVERLKQRVPSCCAELVLNLDEVGISEWEDRVRGKVIVRISMSRPTIHDGVHRNLKQVSVRCSESAGGIHDTIRGLFAS